MNIEELIIHRDRTLPGPVLADDSLQAMRYETVRSLSPRTFAALHASAMMQHRADEDFATAFDRNVDLLILTNAVQAREGERV